MPYVFDPYLGTEGGMVWQGEHLSPDLEGMYRNNEFLSRALAQNPRVREVMDPILTQLAGTEEGWQQYQQAQQGAQDNYQISPWDRGVSAAKSYGLYDDPGRFAALQGQIDALGDPSLSQMWREQSGLNSQTVQQQEAQKLGIPWQAAVMLGLMGAGAGGLLGAAGAPGGAAGGGIVGAGLEGAAASTAGAGLGLGAGEGLVGWDALGNAASGGAGQVGSLAGDMSAGWGVTQGQGGGMDVWDLLGDPSMYGLDSGGLDAWSYGPGNLGESAWDFGPGNIGDMGLSGWNNEMASQLGTTNIMDDIRRMLGGSNGYTSAAKSLLGNMGGGSGTNGSTGGLLGGLLGGNTNSLLGATLGLAPILAGTAWAYNMAGPNTERLESLYDQYNPQAMTGLYDLNTMNMRNDLFSNLGRRGISGSSFANNDLANLQTTRDVGRADLLGRAVGNSASIANSIANQEAVANKIKTDLIGRGLYSIGTLFGGK